MASKFIEFLEKERHFSRPKISRTVPKGKSCMRVVTFNVRFGRRVRDIARSLASQPNLAAADVILLQEIEHHKKEKLPRAEALAKLLGMDFVYVPSRRLPLGRGTHGLAILSRHPLRQPLAIRLPVYPLLRLHPRVAISAEVDFFGQTVKIYNVHLSGSLNYKKRAAQLTKVISHIRRAGQKQPVILAGDLNTIPLFTLAGTSIPLFYSNQKRKLHALLLKQGFETACQAAGYTTKWGLVKFQLDGVYPKNCRLAQFGVERQVRVSDHFPLWADVRV